MITLQHKHLLKFQLTCSHFKFNNIIKRNVGERITETIHVYANGQIVDSYLIPKPPKDVKRLSEEDLQKCHKKVFSYMEQIDDMSHKEYQLADEKIQNEEEYPYIIKKQTNLKLLRYFYHNLPLNDIANLAYYTDYKPSKVLVEQIKTYESSMDMEIFAVFWKRQRISDEKNNNYIILYNKTLRLMLSWIMHKHVKKDIPVEVSYLQTLKIYYPILKLAHILYFIILFKRYLGAIQYVKSHHISFPTYAFIKRNFDLKHMDIVAFRELISHLKNLKYYKSHDQYLLSIKNKKYLYEFIIYLKTYYEVVNKYDVEFDDHGTLTNRVYNEALPRYHDRQSKKYFPKFFGKNASYQEYKMQEKIEELESKAKYPVKLPDNESDIDNLFEEMNIKLQRNTKNKSTPNDSLLSNEGQENPFNTFTDDFSFYENDNLEIEKIPSNESSSDDSHVINSSLESLNSNEITNSKDEQQINENENDDNNETND